MRTLIPRLTYPSATRSHRSGNTNNSASTNHRILLTPAEEVRDDVAYDTLELLLNPETYKTHVALQSVDPIFQSLCINVY